jgi:hypothetical protein
MDRIAHLLRSANVLNLMLLIGIVLMSCLIFRSFNAKDANISLPEAKVKSVSRPLETMSITDSKPTDYMIIAEKNPFHPERRIPLGKTDAQEAAKPDIILYGTLMTDDIGVAYVEDKNAPYTTPGRGKRQIALKKGDSIGGFVLKEIEVNRIILVRGDENIVVSLDEHLKKRMPETSSPASAAAPGFAAPRTAPASSRAPLSGPVPTSQLIAPMPQQPSAPVNPIRARRPGVMPQRPMPQPQ